MMHAWPPFPLSTRRCGVDVVTSTDVWWLPAFGIEDDAVVNNDGENAVADRCDADNDTMDATQTLSALRRKTIGLSADSDVCSNSTIVMWQFE